ncbi:MAG TPA: peptidase dimerization domain-containing protein [Allosphingosinicella sp.]|nr:peptidase dimerization domain-containing protein [Allosphingosinicella sp.]
MTIRVRGVGTHGAYPHMGVDPVLAASQIVVSLQSMVGRDINPLEGAVISVGSIHGGVKSNIIPEEVELQMTGRSNNPAVRTRLLDGIDRVARGTALALGVPVVQCAATRPSTGSGLAALERSGRCSRDR